MCPAGRDRRCLCGVGGYCFTSYLCFCKFLLTRCSTFVYSIFTTPGEGEHARHTSRKVAETPGGGSRFGRHEGRSDTVGGARGRPESSKEARETGDVKTGREGTAGRAKARKGDWAATWVPRQARNKTRDNNFRIPPPAHDVGGKDAEASMARHTLPLPSSRWSRAWRLPVSYSAPVIAALKRQPAKPRLS